MSNQPTLTPKNNTPPEVQKLCEQIHAVATGLPVLVFLPNEDCSRLYPLVVIPDNADAHARQVSAFLEGAKILPPPEEVRQKKDLLLEAIHAAADYLPTIAFLPVGDQIHPVNLVPETVPTQLQPCYRTVQQAQKTAIGTQPLAVH